MGNKLRVTIDFAIVFCIQNCNFLLKICVTKVIQSCYIRREKFFDSLSFVTCAEKIFVTLLPSFRRKKISRRILNAKNPRSIERGKFISCEEVFTREKFLRP